MAESNIISFKFEEYYDNEGTKELKPSTEVKGNVSISLNYIKDSAQSADQIKVIDSSTSTLSRVIVTDSTENIYTLNFLTNDAISYISKQYNAANETFYQDYFDDSETDV